MWFLTVQTIPKTNSLTTAGFGSAAVHCWINFPALDAATQLVNYYLDLEGWLVTNVEFSEWVEISKYGADDLGYKYAIEALNSGASFLIQTSAEDSEHSSVIGKYES